MDTYENENTQNVPQPPVAQPQQPPQQGFGNSVQKESPFANAPYVTYHPYQAQPNYQQPWQPYQQPPQPAPAPQKEKKGGRIALRIVSAVLVVAMIAGGCGLTAKFVNDYWKSQNDKLRLYFNEKVDALQQQIDENKSSIEGNGGILVTPGQSLTASEIYEQNVSSVVAITCIIRTNNFGQIYQSQSAGSGFILTEDGYVVTNHHVIEGASEIRITMNDGTEYTATLIGSDDTNDIALLKMEATGLRPVTIGSSSALKVGDQVVAIGNALGELTSSLTVGYVSGMDRDVTTDGTVINMLQTDVAINSGNSGGPLFNAKGEVIGITSAKYSGTTSSGASIEGISFAIPMNDVIGMLEDLRQYGYIKSAYLGVTVRDVDPAVANAYGFPVGAYVDSVTPGSCAEAAGIQAKDIIVELGGYGVDNMNDLGRALRQFEAGDTATVTVWRAGQELILTIVFDEKPQA